MDRTLHFIGKLNSKIVQTAFPGQTLHFELTDDNVEWSSHLMSKVEEIYSDRTVAFLSALVYPILSKCLQHVLSTFFGNNAPQHFGINLFHIFSGTNEGRWSMKRKLPRDEILFLCNALQKTNSAQARKGSKNSRC